MSGFPILSLTQKINDDGDLSYTKRAYKVGGGNSWIQVINATLLVSKLAKKHSFGDKNLIFFLVYY
jgi:hypothetical protein